MKTDTLTRLLIDCQYSYKRSLTSLNESRCFCVTETKPNYYKMELKQQGQLIKVDMI
jgi:hypothetical protein